jgi:hypothetical protein
MNRKEGSAYYEIRVKGQLDPAWGEWFEDLTVTPLPQGETQISGWIKTNLPCTASWCASGT